MSIINNLRSPTIGNFVIFDFVATIIAAIYVKKIANIGLLAALILLILISIILHAILEIPTTTNYYLGLSEKPIRSQHQS